MWGTNPGVSHHTCGSTRPRDTKAISQNILSHIMLCQSYCVFFKKPSFLSSFEFLKFPIVCKIVAFLPVKLWCSPESTSELLFKILDPYMRFGEARPSKVETRPTYIWKPAWGVGGTHVHQSVNIVWQMTCQQHAYRAQPMTSHPPTPPLNI